VNTLSSDYKTEREVERNGRV